MNSRNATHEGPIARLLVVGQHLASRLASAPQVREVLTASSMNEALAMLEHEPSDAVFAAQELPDGSGTKLVAEARCHWPEIPVVVIARNAGVELAVEAMKAGAADFLLEPVDADAIAFVVSKALELARRTAELPPDRDVRHARFFGASQVMREVENLVRRAAESNATVLVRGESGTGKGMVARAIHDLSPRRDQPFIRLHCSALPDSLLESELFGYERGAFTGADKRKPGRFELANHGTLFLDEIGDISPATQVKLLRVLQEKELERLGGTETLRVDVRFVAATHRDLETMVNRGDFREDLFYRLNVIPVWLPPLRARREDIEPLAREFLARMRREHNKPELRFDDSAFKALRRERWPGNVRQLENFVERLVVLSRGPLLTDRDVDADLGRTVDFTTQVCSVARPDLPADAALDQARVQAERIAIKQALDSTSGNRAAAAKLLGISRRTLYNKLREVGLG